MAAVTPQLAIATVWLTRRQVADLYGVSVRTVQRWGDDGRITPVKLSEHIVRYALHELVELPERSKVHIGNGTTPRRRGGHHQGVEVEVTTGA